MVKFEGLRQWLNRALARSGGRGQEIAFLLEQPEGENDFVFDLHLHDTNSDGVREERKIFAEAQDNRAKKLAQANHDTINSSVNYHSYKTNIGRYNGDYVNSVESGCVLDDFRVECLVYGGNIVKAKQLVDSNQFPYFNRNFKKKRILSVMQQRLGIANKLGITPKYLDLNDFIAVEIPGENGEIKYKTLKSLGLDATRDIGIGKDKIKEEVEINGKSYRVNVDYFNGKLFKYIVQSEKGRAYLASKGVEVSEYDAGTVDMENLEIPTMLKQAYAKFNRNIIQNKESDLFVDDSAWWPTFEQVCDFAKAIGGVAILAHPFGYGNLKISPKELMQRAIKKGADGIECLHGFNTPEQVEEIYSFCKEEGVFITAGSDTHEFYSYQGNKTQVGIAPGVGEDYSQKDNPIHEMPISTYNVHYIGSGAYRKNKNKTAQEIELGM